MIKHHIMTSGNKAISSIFSDEFDVRLQQSDKANLAVKLSEVSVLDGLDSPAEDE